VWAAEEALTGARIAVKLMKGHASSGRVGRLVREYQYLRMLDVEGVPRGRGLGVDDDGTLFLVMDLLEGVAAGTWADRIAAEHKDDRRLIVPRLQRMLAAAAGRLDAVHRVGLVHGDVKPSCFLVGPGDIVSLVDFGASRPIAPDALTDAIGEAFGTPSYSSIEGLSKAPPTTAADTWSLAAAAFRLLTGEHPAPRGSRTEVRAHWQQITIEQLRERMLAACPELPEGAREAVLQSFAREPAARPTLADWRAAMAEGALAEAPTEAPPLRKVRHAIESERAGSPELTAQLVELLRIAGEPLSPRVLALATGRSPRRVLATLEAAEPHVRREGTLSWTLTEPPTSHTSSDHETAQRLADALAGQPIGPARVRALAAADRREEMQVALERWVTALGGVGGLAAALPLLHGLPGSLARGFEARLALVRARAAIAGPSLDVALDQHLERIGAADPLLMPALEKARWALARHFETFHASSRPSALAVGWRAHAVGELDAALVAAETALDEARWLNQGEAEADALVLTAQVHAARGATLHACRLASEAIDRWPPRAPGIGAAVATLARARLQLGAWSEARRLLAMHATHAPTVIDRAHLLLTLAELELQLEHHAVADDALAVVESLLPGSGPRPAAIEARLTALRLVVPGRATLATRAEDAERLLMRYVEDGLALHAPMLAAALASALALLKEWERARAAVDIALDGARFMQDLPAQIGAWAAHARVELAYAEVTGGVVEVSDLLAPLIGKASMAGLWPALMQLALARGDDQAAWFAARQILPNLDLADANALSLIPWAVAARS